jgi:hypothetical protein
VSEDPKLSQSYRELPREEPPRHLDQAILAASRRAAETRPAPLVVPSGRRRWYFPLAAAAIIVLAVAVTMHVERQQDKLEVAEAPVATPPPAREEQPAAAVQAPAEPPRAFTPDPKPAPASPAPAPAPELRAKRRDSERLADLQKPPEAPAPAQDVVSGMRESRRADEARPQARAEAQSAMRPGAAAAAASPYAGASPEQWLQAIDDLKRQGRHAEAERELAEFRKRYPDYRIPEAITEKFEKR